MSNRRALRAGLMGLPGLRSERIDYTADGMRV